jgi:myosin heavy subunit
MLAGLDAASLESWGLTGKGRYALTHSSNDQPDLEAHDAENFARLREALLGMGLHSEEIMSCFQILAGIIHLGDICISGPPASATVEAACADQEVDATDVQFESARHAARLLGMDEEELVHAVRYKKIAIPGRNSFSKVLRTPSQFQQVLHGLIRALYKRLFDRIVEKINASFGAPSGAVESHRDIGILDIYGFERLQQNSFEQLCINLANERLQQCFVENMLVAEQGLYGREGLPWTGLSLPDSEPAVQCISQVFRNLDDFSGRVAMGFDNASDEKFCERVVEDARKDLSQVLRRPRMQNRRRFSESPAINSGFTVQHYAGNVDYTTKGWLHKNNDRLLPDCEALIRDSQQPLVRSLGDEDRSATAFRSVSKRYTTDLQSLLQMLGSAQLQYIRCFKPNSEQAERVFNQPLVLEQIIQCGTVELVRIMHDGFPNRCAFGDLMQRFQAMLPSDFARYGPRTFIEALMRVYGVPQDQWALGFTRLFLKAGQLQVLEALRDEGAQPDAARLADIIRDIVRRRWRRAVQAICFGLWLPKFVAGAREERKMRSVAACRRWRAAMITVRWCSAAASQIHRNRRRRLENVMWCAARVFLCGRRWLARARTSLEARRALEADKRRVAKDSGSIVPAVAESVTAKTSHVPPTEEERQLKALRAEFIRKQKEVMRQLALLREKNACLEREEEVKNAAVSDTSLQTMPTPARSQAVQLRPNERQGADGDAPPNTECTAAPGVRSSTVVAAGRSHIAFGCPITRSPVAGPRRSAGEPAMDYSMQRRCMGEQRRMLLKDLHHDGIIRCADDGPLVSNSSFTSHVSARSALDHRR